MIGIRMIFILLVYVVSGYSLIIESAEYARKNDNRQNEWKNETEMKRLNNVDIARRTRQDIEWHNRKELAYRERHEAQIRCERDCSAIKKMIRHF